MFRRPAGFPAVEAVASLHGVDMEGHMRILLAIDDSECSTAAVKAVIDQFRPTHTQITVLHADDWPEGMSPPMAFAEGPSAARSVLASPQAATEQRRRAAGIRRGAAPPRGFRGRGITARWRPAAHHRPVCERMARRSHRAWDRTARRDSTGCWAASRTAWPNTLRARSKSSALDPPRRSRFIERAKGAERAVAIDPQAEIAAFLSKPDTFGCLPVPSIGSRPTSALCGWRETAPSS